MKFLFSAFTIIYFLISCQTKDKVEMKSNRLIEEFKPFLHGTWVAAGYIEKVIKTKSPLKSSDSLKFISEFAIDTAQFLKDSVNVSAGFGNHEGGDFILYFRKGQNPNSLITSISDFDNESDSYELGYIVSNKDTVLVLYHYDKNKNLVGTIRYLKAPKSNIDGNADGLQYMVNKELVSGKYKVVDSTGTEYQINLTVEGRINGLKGFKSYYILTDFVASSENITDELCFEIGTGDQKCYRFEIVADTINLFETPKNEQDTSFITKPIIYRLIKHH